MKAAVLVHLLYGAARALGAAVWRQTPADVDLVEQYAPDCLAPFSDRARRLAPEISGCIGCGACETLDGSPRALLLASRDLSRLSSAERTLARVEELGPEALARLQARCPASIPFAELPGMLRGA
jgi:hypothetical protein